MADKLLDARGLVCPLPILKTIKAVKEIAPGATLVVLATDPGAVADFEAFCERGGHHLVVANEPAGGFRFTIRRAG